MDNIKYSLALKRYQTQAGQAIRTHFHHGENHPPVICGRKLAKAAKDLPPSSATPAAPAAHFDSKRILSETDKSA
ncbi:hypothetical protein ACPRNU_01330 [Chromobacterium vaccinii]|uniref:hypothetical protein n=1 Tax=Chromobacterium TaxID=535 RepID=UPI0013053C26|nr:hypothetical protein [Chromobacterium sp. ATCC 53434]